MLPARMRRLSISDAPKSEKEPESHDISEPASNETRQKISTKLLLKSTTQVKGKNETIEKFLQRLTHLNLKGDDVKELYLDSIENLDACMNLKVLYLYDNRIQRIENLNNLRNITHLYLQNNCIEKMEGLNFLVHLRKLHLEGNQVECLEGLSSCTKLEELHLSNQIFHKSQAFQFEIESVNAISNSLTILKLDNCLVDSVRELCLLQRLEQLDVSKNQVADIEEVFMLLGSLSRLENLNLLDNPVTKYPKYREKAIIFSQRALETLDSKQIDSSQRMMMQSHTAHKHRSSEHKKPSNEVMEKKEVVQFMKQSMPAVARHTKVPFCLKAKAPKPSSVLLQRNPGFQQFSFDPENR